jgi:hypothetical protein
MQFPWAWSIETAKQRSSPHVAWMKRSEIRDEFAEDFNRCAIVTKDTPDLAALHPGHQLIT